MTNQDLGWLLSINQRIIHLTEKLTGLACDSVRNQYNHLFTQWHSITFNLAVCAIDYPYHNRSGNCCGSLHVVTGQGVQTI